MGSNTAGIDFDAISDADLMRWARARILADAELTYLALNEAGLIGEDEILRTGLHLAAGAVSIATEGGTIYALAPSPVFIGQTPDGREVMYRDGRLVYDLPFGARGAD